MIGHDDFTRIIVHVEINIMRVKLSKKKKCLSTYIDLIFRFRQINLNRNNNNYIYLIIHL